MIGKPVKSAAGTFFLFLFSFILPAAALLVGLGMSDDWFDPMPSSLHVAMVAAVTLIGFTLCVIRLRGKDANRKWVMALCGLSFGISIVYTVLMIPYMVFGAMAVVFAFWYFGIGFLGLLPWAPCSTMVCALVFRRKFRKSAVERGLKPASGFLAGLIVAAALWVATVSGGLITVYGVNLALSSDPAVSAKGVRMLRNVGRNNVFREICDGSRRGIVRGEFFGSGISWCDLLNENARLQLSDGRGEEFFYRVTGEDIKLYRSRGRRGLGPGSKLRWDTITGGDKVGGALEGLSLKGSAYDTTIDSAAGIAYSEWTITFGNTYFSDREARMRLALPPRGTVSRLTLWINGEECEAAFGGRGQVRRAYEQIVSRHRDPVLVTTCGPDEVQVQCFPVPRDGEMKLRLGISFPLQVAADGRSYTMQAPAIIAKNFSIAPNMLGLPKTKTGAFERPLPAVAAFRTDDTNLLSNAAIVQRNADAPSWRPEAVAVVVDTSLAMKGSLDGLEGALAKIPDGIDVEIWLTDDEPPTKPTYTDKTGIAPFVFCGGKDNLRPLLKATESLAARGKSAALVWLYGPQPYTDSSSDVLALALNRNPNLRTYLVKCADGENPLVEALPQTGNVRNYSAVSMEKGACAALETIAAGWNGAFLSPVREKVALDAVPADAVKASDHLGRLWAAESAARTFRSGDPKTLEPAKEIALPWHVVTPVTGAVVLETQQQYNANGLEQVKSESVPTVPEPESVFCLAVVALVMFVTLFLSRRRKMAKRL